MTAIDLVAPVSQYLLGLLGGLAAALLLMILRALDQPDALQVFTEDAGSTVQDFEWLTGASALMFTAFALFTVGVYYENVHLVAVGRFVEVGFFTVMVAIFYRWWRRFT